MAVVLAEAVAVEVASVLLAQVVEQALVAQEVQAIEVLARLLALLHPLHAQALVEIEYRVRIIIAQNMECQDNQHQCLYQMAEAARITT